LVVLAPKCPTTFPEKIASPAFVEGVEKIIKLARDAVALSVVSSGPSWLNRPRPCYSEAGQSTGENDAFWLDG